MANKLSGERKYKVTVEVTRLEGLPTEEEEEEAAAAAATTMAAVEVRWNRPNAASTRGGALVSCFVGRGRRRRSRCVSPAKPVGSDGAVEWGDGEASRFGSVWFSRPSEEEVGNGADPRSSWDVSFSVLIGTQKRGKRRERKLEEMGTAMVSLAQWARASQPQKQKQVKRVTGNEPMLEPKPKQVTVTLINKGWTWDVTLHVSVSFTEVTSCEGTEEVQSLCEEQMLNKRKGSEVEKMTNIRAAKSSSYFTSETSNLDRLRRLANAEDKLVVYSTRNPTGNSSSCRSSSSSSGGSRSGDTILSSSSVSNCSIVSSRRKIKLAAISKSLKEKESKMKHVSTPLYALFDKETATVNKLTESDLEDDPIGTWKTKEFASRDRRTGLKTPIFFASIDQRDETAGGESACTALVAVFANSLHGNQLSTPTRSKFDALIREGSSEWRKLCKNAYYKKRFPNKHFDLDTVLEAKIRPISVLPEKSFVGFFYPESFESLRGAMSFDGIWDEISAGKKDGESKVYIVSWNDHFFVLKVEENAYYIVDTLGERLFEGCSRAYILRFDDTTEMYKLRSNGEEREIDEVISKGKECCREFISRFLASITLKEELEMEMKGEENDSASRHRRLQIEFHYTILREEEVRGQSEQLADSSELNAKALDLDQVVISDTSSGSGAKVWNLDQLLQLVDRDEKVAFYGHRERAKGRIRDGVKSRVDYL